MRLKDVEIQCERVKWYMDIEPTSHSESIEFDRRGSFAESGDSSDEMSLEGSYRLRVVEIMTKEPWDFFTLDFHTLKVVKVGQAVHFITDLVGQNDMRGEAHAFLDHEKNCLKCPIDRPWPATYLSLSIQVQASFVMVNWARNFLSNRGGIQLQRVEKRLWRQWTWSTGRMP